MHQTRRFRWWYIPLVLMILLSGFVAGARAMGSSRDSLFDCTILTSRQSPAVIAVDASKMLRNVVKDSLTKTSEVITSPDLSYTAFAKTEILGESSKTTIFIRTNANQKAVGLPNINSVRSVNWSPDGRFVAVSGLAQKLQVLILARSDGTDAHTIRVTTPANPSWSRDSAYLAYPTAAGITVIGTADFTQSQVIAMPRGGLQWLPESHTLIYTQDDTLSLYEVDTTTEHRYQFPLQSGDMLDFTWTSDGHALAVYLDNNGSKSQLTLYSVADGQLRKLDFAAGDDKFNSIFWLPDNQAIAMVTAQHSSLVAYWLTDKHSEVLVPDGFLGLLAPRDDNRILFTRHQTKNMSINLLDLTSHQVTEIKRDVDYLWSIQADKSYLVVQMQDNIYSIIMMNIATGEETQIISGLPTLPIVREVNDSTEVIMWVTPDGGGLARYSLADKSLSFYHVNIIPRWVLVKTLLAFSPDLRQVAVGVQEPNGTMLQVASLDKKPPVMLYQSSDGYNWVGMLDWSADSSELLYGIANGGPAKLARSDGQELRIFSQHQDVSYASCDDYFRN